MYRKGAKKYIVVSKKAVESIVVNEAILEINQTIEAFIISLLKSYPLTDKEKNELTPKIQTGQSKLKLFDF